MNLIIEYTIYLKPRLGTKYTWIDKLDNNGIRWLRDDLIRIRNGNNSQNRIFYMDY